MDEKIIIIIIWMITWSLCRLTVPFVCQMVYVSICFSFLNSESTFWNHKCNIYLWWKLKNNFFCSSCGENVRFFNGAVDSIFREILLLGYWFSLIKLPLLLLKTLSDRDEFSDETTNTKNNRWIFLIWNKRF